jgi:hypothetical protein
MEDEKGRACSMHEEEEECLQGFGGKTGKKEIIREN